ncbi:AlwI family type II restriction endonuclease [Mycoplasmopsis meleagridis]|uniref:AlwI family type II restriction endonuclease n=1 Tax=Mycoplasmopsis meleagridis TaxID=29561 RepID=UPI003A86E0C2
MKVGVNMKLDSITSIYNMGDTSIRVKQTVEINKIILRVLDKFMSNSVKWNKNVNLQENFYKTFLNEIVRLESEEGIELFKDFKRSKHYKLPSSGKVGFRGRTLTNPLVKIGLINSARKLSSLGNNYLDSKLKPADEIEKILDLDKDNLLYFRQFMKLRIYEHNSDNYFYNYRFAIKFLSKYDDVPQNNLLAILESIKPCLSNDELEEIISKYSQVQNGNVSFDEFFSSTFSRYIISEEKILEAKDMFNNKQFSDENFAKLFSNRDSKKTSLLYKDFVLFLIEAQDNPENNDVIPHLYKLSRNSKIKKAFGAGKIPIKISKNDTTKTFLKNNSGNPLLGNDHYGKYLQFLFSKNNDLIHEYSDMGRRAFQVTGLISFNNGLANLNNKWIISPLLEILGDKFSLSGNDSYFEYEENDDSFWFSDTTLTEIFSITNNEIEKLFAIIGKNFNTKNISEISKLIEDKQENEFREFVEKTFPKEKIITILNNIIVRNDDEVFNEVTDNATIPTIYEYILTIAWYHISKNKSFKLLDTFQVSLDGNKLPLTHRGSGAGDIEIKSDDYSLLIEATLMNMNAQKRGELEPVIRHSTNFAVDNHPTKT